MHSFNTQFYLNVQVCNHTMAYKITLFFITLFNYKFNSVEYLFFRDFGCYTALHSEMVSFEIMLLIPTIHDTCRIWPSALNLIWLPIMTKLFNNTQFKNIFIDTLKIRFLLNALILINPTSFLNTSKEKTSIKINLANWQEEADECSIC